jgi:hypothetical protein
VAALSAQEEVQLVMVVVLSGLEVAPLGWEVAPSDLVVGVVASELRLV